MEIKVRDDVQLVEIWLSRKEQEDAEVQEKLRPLYKEYEKQHYLVATFRSGDDDLLDLTRSLLIHNRDLAARTAVREEREMQMSM